VKVIEGKLDGSGLKVGIAIARFNQLVTGQLLSGAVETLRRCGVADGDVHVAWVPGSMELPVVAQRMARSRKYDAVICLGAVIRGETPHFDYVAGEAAKGIARVALDTGVPVIFGVLTTENTQQALERSGVKSGNKGCDAALAAVEMAQLLKQLPSGK
jgi:6,7-dimethyl-8-ribityllumazine synthase